MLRRRMTNVYSSTYMIPRTLHQQLQHRQQHQHLLCALKTLYPMHDWPWAASTTQNSISSISCYQLNLHRSISPLDNLQSPLYKQDTDALICFLQEPPISSSSRTIGASNTMETILETDPPNVQNWPRAAILLQLYPFNSVYF